MTLRVGGSLRGKHLTSCTRDAGLSKISGLCGVISWPKCKREYPFPMLNKLFTQLLCLVGHRFC